MNSLFPKPSKGMSSPDKRWLSDTKVQWPRDFRRFMGWAFLASSPSSVTASIKGIWYAAHHRYYPVPPLRNLLFAPTFSVVVVIILCVAWWTIWRRKSSAQAWGTAASVTYILTFVRQFIVPLRPALDHEVTWLFVGIVGLVTFLWPKKQAASTRES